MATVTLGLVQGLPLEPRPAPARVPAQVPAQVPGLARTLALLPCARGLQHDQEGRSRTVRRRWTAAPPAQVLVLVLALVPPASWPLASQLAC